MLIFALGLAVFGMAVLSKCVVVVPRDEAFVIERLGVYRYTIMTGMHVLAPFVDRVAFRYTLQPRKQEMSDVCITEDNMSVTVTSSFRWRIVDARRFAYSAADGADFVVSLVRSHHRKWIGSRSLNEARENIREMEASVVTSVTDAAREVGAEIVAADIYTLASSGQESGAT